MIDIIKRDLERIYQDKPHRLKHIYGVLETALKLGKIHNLDSQKLTYAALLHDITKYEDTSFHQSIIKEHYENADEILNDFNAQILHSFSATIIATESYGVTDIDVLDSILSHTIGRPNMSIYEKVIFISDYIEPNRTYESCVKVRSIAFDNLDKAVYTAIDDSITFFEKENHQIPSQAYKARDYYKQLLEEQHGKN